MSLKEGPDKEFGASLKEFTMNSLFELLVSEPNFATWVKFLGHPLSIQKVL